MLLSDVYCIIHYCAFAGECKFKDLVSKRLITKGISLQRHIKKSANKDNISIPYSRYNIPSLNKIILINYNLNSTDKLFPITSIGI